jgi:6-phosphogluconate dehydrogenase-like protein
MLSERRNGVVACSALKQSYRDVLIVDSNSVKVVYLKGSKQVIAERLRHRADHFMNPVLLQSQFDTLEEPRDAIIVEVSKAPEAIVNAIIVKGGLDRAADRRCSKWTCQAIRRFIAIIGAGEMGVAVGRRLREAGARVLISLNGRSAASVDRVHRAGLEGIYDDQRLTDGVNCILSIVPPAAALEVAERLHTSLCNAASPPPFADCNAIAPTTMRRIERLFDPLLVVDAGIIGGPPLPGRRIRPPDRASTPPGRTHIGSRPSLDTASISPWWTRLSAPHRVSS